MMWVVIGFLGLAFVLVILAACKCAVEEDELMHFRPPDDDGVTIREMTDHDDA